MLFLFTLALALILANPNMPFLHNQIREAQVATEPRVARVPMRSKKDKAS